MTVARNDLRKNEMPGLSAFLRVKKFVVEIAVEACTKLVVNTGHKTSLYKQFLIICKVHETPKKVGSYKQRRFTKLGYCAGAIVHYMDEFKSLLQKHHSNLHSQACKLYIETPFIVDAMVALSRVTEFVTLPYLEMVQKVTHTDLLQILPRLYSDLKQHNLNTLSDYENEFLKEKLKVLW